MNHTFTSEGFAAGMEGGMYVGLDTVEMDVQYGYPSGSEAAEEGNARAEEALQADGGDPGAPAA